MSVRGDGRAASERPGFGPGFRTLWLSRVVSEGTSALTLVPLPIFATQQGGAGLGSAVLFAEAVGGLLAGLAGGFLADAVRKDVAPVTCALLRAGAFLCIGLGVALVPVLATPTLLIVFGLVCGLTVSLFASIEVAAVRVLVPEQLVGRAVSLNQGRSQATLLIGPPAGTSLFLWSQAAPFLVAAAGLLFGAALSWRLRPHLSSSGGVGGVSLGAAARGYSWVLSRAELRFLFLAAVFFNGVTLWPILIIYLIRSDVDPALISVLAPAFGILGVLGSLMAGSERVAAVSARRLGQGFLGVSLVLAVAGFLGDVRFVTGACLLCAATAPVVAVAVIARQSLATPVALVGRVTSVFIVGAMGGAAIGQAVGAAIVSSSAGGGAYAFMFLAACAGLGSVCLWCVPTGSTDARLAA